MFKIVHLSAGVAALLLSFTPTLGNASPTLLQQPDAVYLVFCALINLLAAGLGTNQPRTPLKTAASALLVLAAALQAFVVLFPMPQVAGQPSVVLALTALVAGSVLQLLERLPARRKSPGRTSSGNQDNREMGTVKWFNTSKGFGFISRDSGDDIFVHFRAIRGEGHRVLVEGQRVEFAVMLRDKGLQAEDVIATPPTQR